MATMTITQTLTEIETCTKPVIRAINEDKILAERQRQRQRQQTRTRTQTPTPGPYPVKMKCPCCSTQITTR